MTSDPTRAADPALVWGDDGLPRSGRFGDVYFSSDDGLAETRAVFLTGCGLPEAWAGRRQFVVGELGFGTGLNIAALLELWRRHRPVSGRLNVFSIEAFPVSRDDAARALGRWPELAQVTARMLAQWPRRSSGFHRLDLPDLDATIDLAVMDVESALDQWTGRADAWFLDGFAPATNPQMWSQPILDRIAAASAPGARAATFTVAGVVRRGLQTAGFTVEKRPGHGRKRERLEARLAGDPAMIAGSPTVAILGAGIAGASLARAFRRLGVEPVVIDAVGPGGGASGNPAALVTPRLDAGLGPSAALHAQAFNHAVDLYAALPSAVIAGGSLQLEATPRDPARFDTLARADLFEDGTLIRLDEAQTSARLGEDTPAGLDIRDAVVLDPAMALKAWTGPVLLASVDRIETREGRQVLIDAKGAVLCTVDVVCIAGGHASATFAPELTLQPIRGQASWTTDPEPAAAVSKGGYVIPLRDGGVLFGATFDRDRTDTATLPGDHDRNRALLAETLPRLAGRIASHQLQGRASIRAATRDRLPLAGPMTETPGRYILAGLGSRGFSTAPLLAEHVAALVTGAPSPLPADLARLVDPARFADRTRRRASIRS